MSYCRNHAIIVSTNYNHVDLIAAHEKALKLFSNTSPILDSLTNDVKTFLIPPDGSYEGWDGSNEGDLRRSIFIKYLKNLEYGNFDWVEIQYGDDNSQTKVISHSDEYNDE